MYMKQVISENKKGEYTIHTRKGKQTCTSLHKALLYARWQ